VSWIWDVDFEACRGRVGLVVVSGQRARDLALRVKHAELMEHDARRGAPGPGGQLLVDEDVVRAFWSAIERTSPGETLYVLATYTALWALRRELVRLGHLAPFWQHPEAAGAVAT